MRQAAPAATLLIAALVGLAAPAGLRAEPAPDRRPAPSSARKTPAMERIRLRFTGTNGESVAATLEDGAAARAFRALLPLTLNLTDYNATEKIADLPARLPTQGEPAGLDPAPGDLAYYAPWGNLAIFYEDFAYSRGLIRLGRLDRIPDALRTPGPVTVTLEALPARE